MAAFAPDFATAMGVCAAQLRGLEHAARLSERFARVLVQFADGAAGVCRSTGNAPVECSNELACFLSSESGAVRDRAGALRELVGVCRKTLQRQKRYLEYLEKRAKNIPPEAAAEFSVASAAELEKLRAEQAWMEARFRTLVCGDALALSGAPVL